MGYRTKPTKQQTEKARISRRRAMENRNRKNEERRRNRHPHRDNQQKPTATTDLTK
jgi:hypothetical protein